MFKSSRLALVSAVPLTFLSLGSTGASAAAPSAACTQINNGLFDLHVDEYTTPSPYVTASVSGLAAGETLSFQIANVGALGVDQWWISGGSLLADWNGQSTVNNITYTVTGSGDTSIYSVVRIQSGAVGKSITVTATCAAAPGGTGVDNSTRLERAQHLASQRVSQTSGSAISNAASAGTDAAFEGAAPFGMSNGSITLNYAARPIQTGRTRQAFAALGYADDATVDAPAPDQPWNVWANLRGSWLTNNTDGHQINATLGAGYRLTPALVLGAFAGYEDFDYSFDGLGASVEGNGGTIGTYAGWRISEILRLDGMIGWSGVSYDSDANGTTASYDASRWLVSGGLTGAHIFKGFRIAPTANLFVVWEADDAYVDSDGTAHDEFDFYTGRASLGGRISKGLTLTEALLITPYLSAYGDWRFSGEETGISDPTVTGVEDGWSARFGTGFSIVATNGLNVSLGGEVGGIGQDTQIWSASGRVGLLF